MVTRGKTYHDRKAEYKKRVEGWKMKGWTFPNNFTLLQDSREQRPLFQRLPSGLSIRSCALKVGDYSVAGFEDGGICFERKQISDFISFCTSERERTVEKMKRMAEFEWAALIIEANEDQIICPQEFSKVSPETLRQALNSFSVRYGIHLYFNADREACARFLLDRALKFVEIKREV